MTTGTNVNSWSWTASGDTKSFRMLIGTNGINQSIHVHLDGRINRWDGLCQTSTCEFEYRCTPYQSEVFGKVGNHAYKMQYANTQEWDNFSAWLASVLENCELINSRIRHCDGRTASYRQDHATGHVW